MSDPRSALHDSMAKFAGEERDRLPDVSLRDFLAYGEGRLDDERGDDVRKWLAVDARCSQLMFEFRRAMRIEESIAESIEFEVEREWRALEACLTPGRNRSEERFRRVGAVAAMILAAALGWVVCHIH